MLSSVILSDQYMNTVDVVGRGNVQEEKKIVLCKVNIEVLLDLRAEKNDWSDFL